MKRRLLLSAALFAPSAYAGDLKINACYSGGSTIACLAQIASVDGSVSTPAFTFSADPDTGIYRVGTNELGIAANGVKVADVSVGSGGPWVFGDSAATSQTEDQFYMGTSGSGVWLRGASGAGFKSWLIGANDSNANTFEITPSTANGGVTKGTVALKIAENGGVTIGDNTGGTGNVVHACTRRTGSASGSGGTSATATCSAGEILTGGGCSVSTSAGAVGLIESYPSSTTVWTCTRLASGGGTMTAYGLCCTY